MKKLFNISILVFILGCNQSKVKIPDQAGMVAVVDTIIEENIETKNNLKRLKPTNGVFSLDDLSSELFLVFGTREYELNNAWDYISGDSLRGFIINPSYEESTNLLGLRPQRVYIHPKNDSLPVCQFENSLLIPFTANEDRSHLTIWKIISTDSMQFDGIIQPSIESRYAKIVSINMIELKGEDYFWIYMTGGEGGGNWDELIMARYDGQNKLEIIVNEQVGYCRDCGDWAKIQLSVNQNGFEIMEIRDSMKLIDDRWERAWRKVKKLKVINM